MNKVRGRALMGASLLAVAVVSSFATAGASAATTTAYTCTAGSGAGFSDEHCLNAVGSGASYVHVPITQSTNITITNAHTANNTTEAAPGTFKMSIAGVEVMLSCTTVNGTGTLVNQFAPPEMIVNGTAELTLSGCTVEQPADCTISGGTITTNPLKFTSALQTMAIKITPEMGSVLANITIDGCSATVFNGTWPLSGSLTIAPSGATLTTTHAGTTGSLTFGSWKVGLSSSLTLKGESGAGISFTT